MPYDADTAVAKATAHWQAGRYLEAGELLFETLPLEVRPKWAARVLRAAVDKSGIEFAPIENVLRIANHPEQWGEAHNAFTVLRESTFELGKNKFRTKEQELFLCLLYLAENVAKVIYNTSGLPWAFDEDSGWWVAQALRDVLDEVGDPEFSQSAWLLLCAREDSPTS